MTATWGIGGNGSRAVNAVTTALTAVLGGQTDLQTVTNTLAPYAAQVIGKEFGHGEDKNVAAQMIAHALLGATLAYINGGDPTAGGSAAVASEAAAIYLANQYKDNKEYQDENGVFQANLLPEEVKAQIRDLTAGIGAVIGGAVGDSSYNAQLAGVIGQNAVENNIDSPKDYQNAPAYSEQLYKDACAAYGLSGAACDAQIRKDRYEILKGTALVLLPTEPYEYVPLGGKAVGIVIKGTKKLKAVFKNAEEAQKAADKAKVKVENNIHRDDDLLNKSYGKGDERATKFGSNWQIANLKTVIDKFAGKSPKIERTDSGKVIYTNKENGRQVVYDTKGQYFRILDTTIKGKRQYLDLNGNVPNNKTLPNGKVAGRSQGEYNEATHFKLDKVTY